MRTKIIIYIDLDDTIFDYKSAFKEALLVNPSHPFPQSCLHFFYNLKPIDGAVETVTWMFEQSLFDVYFLTAPSVENPLCYTEKRLSLDKHFGASIGSRIIISPNKGLNKGHYLIDDISEGKGQENFEGKLLHFGSNNFPNWISIRNYFLLNYISTEAI